MQFKIIVQNENNLNKNRTGETHETSIGFWLWLAHSNVIFPSLQKLPKTAAFLLHVFLK